MRLLLDTQVLMWWQFQLRQLRHDVAELIRATDLVYISAASAWEAEIKRKHGKLDFPGDFADVLTGNGFTELPITMRHAAEAATLPLHHRDPFDRMLIAQAMIEECTLVTADRRLEVYGVPFVDASPQRR